MQGKGGTAIDNDELVYSLIAVSLACTSKKWLSPLDEDNRRPWRREQIDRSIKIGMP